MTPGSGLALVAELLERIGEQQLRRLVLRLRHDDVVQHLHDPAVVALREVAAGALDHRVGAAHVVEIARTGLGWR